MVLGITYNVVIIAKYFTAKGFILRRGEGESILILKDKGA